MRFAHLVYLGLLLTLPCAASAQNWTALSTGSTSSIRAIEDGSSSDLWLVGDNGLVAQSDVTRTVWTLESVGTALDLYAIRRPASSEVWVGGESGVVRVKTSADWLVRDAPTTQRVVLYSRETACQNALGDAGGMHQTCDLGLNWDPMTSGTSSSLNHGAGFITSSSWVVGDNGTILFSDDGGSTWTPQTSGTTANLHYIIQAGSGWNVIVGDDGTILRSNDGGANWTPVALSTNANLWNVTDSGQNGAWLLAVGEQGTVLKSTDTGATWCQLDPETTVDLYTGTMVSNSEYIVGGVGGVLMRTTNGGGDCLNPTAVIQATWGRIKAKYASTPQENQGGQR